MPSLSATSSEEARHARKGVLACTAVVPLEAQTSFATRTVNDRHYTPVVARYSLDGWR